MARIISALILIPLAILVVIYATPIYFLIGIGLIGTFCLYEYFGLMRAMGIHVQPLFACLAFWVLLVAFYQDQYPAGILLAFVMIAAFLSAIWRRRPVKERAFALIAELFGIFYFVLFLYPAVPIRYDFGDKTGMQWTILLLAVIWAGDTVALVVGKWIGKHPFAPILSPKKTQEGAIAGLLGSIGVGAAIQPLFLAELPLYHVIAISALLGIFGQLGDLAESMLKRAAEIKDSSHIIPGHGGVLDRMDSLLFAVPVLYFCLLQLY
ncbi:MAG: phosphatidate cytidylyltransferase [Acidobacteria bacterium]|nr:phosphatidate cytidylyltransferase [Acidobacteriota bacterium]